MEEKKVFKPLPRVLFDIIVFLVCLFFIVYACGLTSLKVAFVLGGGMGLVASLFWICVIIPWVKIELNNETISGPISLGRRIIIPVKELNQELSIHRKKRAKFFGYYDLIANDGKKIRMWRRLIGRRQVYKIMMEVERIQQWAKK